MYTQTDTKITKISRAVYHQLRYWFGYFGDLDTQEPEPEPQERTDLATSTCSPGRNRADDAYWQSMANWMASQ